MSQKPPINAPNPYPVPLVSRSKVILGLLFLYSAMSCGANSSPNVFEPRMVIFPDGAVPGAGLLPGQPATTVPIKIKLRLFKRPFFVGLNRLSCKAVFMACLFVYGENSSVQPHRPGQIYQEKNPRGCLRPATWVGRMPNRTRFQLEPSVTSPTLNPPARAGAPLPVWSGS